MTCFQVVVYLRIQFKPFGTINRPHQRDSYRRSIRAAAATSTSV